MNQPLVPTRIVDRNGKQTTVHRKAAQQSGSEWKPPAVAVSVPTGLSAEEREQMITAIRYKASASILRGQNMVGLERHLSGFDDDLLKSIRECQVNVPTGHARVNGAIVDKCSSSEVREMIHFSPLVEDAHRYTALMMIIRSLRHYPQLPEATEYSSAEEPVRAKAEALVKVLCEVFWGRGKGAFTGDGSTYPDDELIDLVVSSPEKAELIANFIVDRETTDVNLIRELVANDAVPLSDGVL